MVYTKRNAKVIKKQETLGSVKVMYGTPAWQLLYLWHVDDRDGKQIAKIPAGCTPVRLSLRFDKNCGAGWPSDLTNFEHSTVHM